MSRRLNQVEFNSLDIARTESAPVIWRGRIPSSVRDDYRAEMPVSLARIFKGNYESTPQPACR